MPPLWAACICVTERDNRGQIVRIVYQQILTNADTHLLKFPALPSHTQTVCFRYLRIHFLVACSSRCLHVLYCFRRSVSTNCGVIFLYSTIWNGLSIFFFPFVLPFYLISLINYETPRLWNAKRIKMFEKAQSCATSVLLPIFWLWVEWIGRPWLNLGVFSLPPHSFDSWLSLQKCNE